MTQAKKPTTLLIALVAGIVILVALILAVVFLELRSRQQTPAPQPTTVETTTQATTLPPPPANVFDPADFTYDEQGYLACTAGPYERGIDVSAYQGEVDWQQVADSGMEFVIIRVGGRGYGSSGTLYDDKLAQINYEGARQAGLKVGAYFFSQAVSPQEAVEEAEYLLEKTKDWVLDMPLVYDWEYISEEARTAQVDQQTLTDCMLAFCRRIEEAGKEPMIYFNPNHSLRLFHIEQVTDYPFWLAMYTDWMTYPYKIHMWQYTNAGSVPGVTGNVDINLCFRYETE